MILDLANRPVQDKYEKANEKKQALPRLQSWEYTQVKKAVETNKAYDLEGHKYLLVKLPLYDIPPTILTVFYELQIRGIVPIIIDAEKYKYFMKNPNLLFEIARRGALIQINASSLIERKHGHRKRFAKKLCKHHLVHLIASDIKRGNCHSTKEDQALQKVLTSRQRNEISRNEKDVLRGVDFQSPLPKKFHESKLWKLKRGAYFEGGTNHYKDG